jgi:UDP-glucose 4-epimerase
LKKNKNKVLVIGGSGFLGSHVADALSKKNYSVFILDKVKSRYLKKNQNMIIGDITEQKVIDKNVKNKNFVFNFAGIADIDESKTMPLETIHQNVIPSIKISQACIKYKVQKYILASTIYVDSDQGYFYKCSKQAAEKYIEEFSKIHKMKYCILRFGSLYGSRASLNNGLYRLINEVVNSNKITYVGKSDAQREYIHVLDAANACLDLLDKKYDNQKITVTGENKFKIEEIIKIISEILNKKIKVKYLNKFSDNLGHYHVTPYTFKEDINKKYTLPFHIDIGQGIIDIIKDIKKTQ